MKGKLSLVLKHRAVEVYKGNGVENLQISELDTRRHLVQGMVIRDKHRLDETHVWSAGGDEMKS
jgi:cobalamin biosynthesis protein CobD/CbiB